jgi:hypothetical protein
MKKTIYFLLLSIAYIHSAIAMEGAKKPNLCLSTREFVTTLEFLREHKELGLGEADARAISHKVS